MRIVLDATVLVSGLISPIGPPGQILDKWLTGDFQLFISPHNLGGIAPRPVLSPHHRTIIQGADHRAPQ